MNAVPKYPLQTSKKEKLINYKSPVVLWAEIVMLTVFGDESVDASGKKVFAVAGLLGDDSQWRFLREKWVAKTGGKIFHASDCECDKKEFNHTPHVANLALYKDLTIILSQSGLIGFGVAIDLEGLRKFFPDILEENPYLSCLLRTVKFLTEKAAQCIPSSDVEFTFDQNLDNEYNAGLIYQYIKQQKDWSAGSLLAADKISFATRKEPGIQAADLWAREVMKRLEGHLENRPPRKSILALQKTKLFGADLLLEGFYEGLKSKMPMLQKREGLYFQDYLQWLGKRQDNSSNRITYLMYTEKPELEDDRNEK
jgi:hypothetical protein